MKEKLLLSWYMSKWSLRKIRSDVLFELVVTFIFASRSSCSSTSITELKVSNSLLVLISNLKGVEVNLKSFSLICTDSWENDAYEGEYKKFSSLDSYASTGSPMIPVTKGKGVS